MNAKLVAVIGALGLVASASAEISSANAVGYHTINIYPGNNMFTVNFENMDDSEGYTLDQIFPGTTPGLKAQQQPTQADWIMTWDPAKGTTGGYSTQYFLYHRSSNKLNEHWVYLSGATPTAAPVKIKSGMCFWFYHNKNDSITYPIQFTVAGQVEYTQSGANITIHKGNNMIGAPFAADLDLNDLGSEFWKARYDAGEAIAAQQPTGADSILTWNPTLGETGGYGTQYFLYRRSTNALNYNWVYLNGATPVKAPNGFIKMGTGAWYMAKGNGFTMSIPYPYDLSK